MSFKRFITGIILKTLNQPHVTVSYYNYQKQLYLYNYSCKETQQLKILLLSMIDN